MNLELLLSRTMLVERLMGVFVYVIVTLYGYSRIMHTESPKKLKGVFTAVWIALGIMAFFYIPGNAADLCEWRNIYDAYWDHRTFFEFLKGPVLDSSTPVSYIVIYLCQKTGLQGLLPCVVALVFFGFVFAIFKDCAKRCKLHDNTEKITKSLFKNNVNGRTNATYALALTLLCFMAAGEFLEVISGVRCLTALSIMAWCIYTEMVGERTLLKNFLIYGIACLVHLVAIPIFAVRLLYILVGQLGNKIPKAGNYITALVLSLVGVAVGGRFLIAAFEKGVSYLSNSWYSYTWEYLIGFMQLALILVTLIQYRKIKEEDGLGHLKALSLFNAFMCAVEIVFCFEYTIFHRFIMFSSIIIVPIMYTVLQYKLQKNDYRYVNFVRVLTLVMFFIACARGNLCGYKFFLLNY